MAENTESRPKLFTEKVQEHAEKMWGAMHENVPELQGVVVVPVWDSRLQATELPFALMFGAHDTPGYQLRLLQQLQKILQNRVTRLADMLTELHEYADMLETRIRDAKTKHETEKT